MSLNLAKKLLLWASTLGVGLLYVVPTQAQHRCATVELEQIRHAKNRFLEDNEFFENWLKQKNQERKLRQGTQQTFKVTAEVLTVPVVVHVIHNGEAIGTGSNISDSQILSQIEVLNEDFRRMNADASNTPAQFLPVASDIEIEFVLAKQDPEGLPTTGILRTQGSQTLWGIGNNLTLKAHSYWPAENYLNIWVAPLGGGLLGFAQFPVSNLEGLEQSSNNALTDGVVVTPTAFGSIDKDPTANLSSRFDLGRTASHEVGHFLGLRHIWGDGDCDDDDFCTDTPNASGPATGCPSSKSTCGSDDMYQNFMDFSDDACMNLFTTCQKDRMRTVMEFSPRRASLAASVGDEDPIIVANDAGIRQIISPQAGVCNTSITPQIEVRNYGDNLVTDATIDVRFGGSMVETLTPTLNLNPQETAIVTFSAIGIPNPGEYNLEFEITATNGTTDGNALNNVSNLSITKPESGSLPFSEGLTSLPVNWTINNSDASFTWEIANAPNEEPTNNSLFINFFDYENGLGEVDYFISPVLDFTGLERAKLFFEVAYAQFPGQTEDGLMVALSTDCGNNFSSILYNKFASDLATVDPTSARFTPSSVVDWRQEIVDLNSFIGETQVQIAFIAQNGFGNNLYIDNIQLQTEEIPDVAAVAVAAPSFVTCTNQQPVALTVANNGTEILTSVSVVLDLNGSQTIIPVDNLNILPGSAVVVDLPIQNFPAGESTLNLTLTDPNGFPDVTPENNEISHKILVDNTVNTIPLRERFLTTSFAETEWSEVNPDEGVAWNIVTADRNGESNFSAQIGQFGLSVSGTLDYLISPVLDLTAFTEAALLFDVSYANRQSVDDILRVLVTTNCGDSFTEVYSKSGGNLAVTTSESSWLPTLDTDWRREFVDLSNYTGNAEVRVVFEFENNGGNNLYIDNIEFFQSNDNDPLQITEGTLRIFPNPAENSRFNLTLNLADRQDVVVTILDRIGRPLYQETFNNTLNQTYQFDLTGNASGLYLMQVVGPNFRTIERFVIKN